MTSTTTSSLLLFSSFKLIKISPEKRETIFTKLVYHFLKGALICQKVMIYPPDITLRIIAKCLQEVL
jgi:hypothetical protein